MRRLVLITLAAAGMAAPALAQHPRSWTQPVAPYRVIGDVYFVGTEGLSAFLIAGPKGHVLLDGGLPANAPQIESSIRALGFRPADVKILLNSHAHFDHAGGLAALKQATGAKLYASAGDRPSLEGGIHIGDNDNGATRFPAVKVDRVVRDGETVRLGPVAMTAHVTPGHTRGCTTWTLPVAEAERRHHAVFHCSTTVAGNRLVGNTGHPTIVADYRRSFARLKRLKADVLLPNHPEFADLHGKRRRAAEGGANPFVDPSAYGAFLARSEQAFEKALAEASR